MVKKEPEGPPVAPWVALGVGVAAGVAGSVFALRARSQSSDAKTQQFQDDASASLDSAKTSATIAYASFGVAAVGAATFAVTYLMSSGSSGSGSDAPAK